MSEELDGSATEAEAVDTLPATDQPEIEATDDGVDGESAEDQPDAEAEDLEEVDWEGKKVRVPPEVKAALMRTEDYTRKTQALAEERRAAEVERTRQAESFEALRADHVRVHTLESQVEAFKNVDWQTALANDPDNARIALDQYRALQITLEDAKRDLSTKEAQRLESQRSSNAKALEETGRVLSRDIKGWNQQLAGQLVQLAGEFGVSQEDLLSNPNPRDWKILHELHTLRQQVKKQTVTKRQEAVTSVQPAKTVGAKSAPPVGLDDRLSTAEWVARRNAQEAAKRKALGR
jgi:hypothetical protein